MAHQRRYNMWGVTSWEQQVSCTFPAWEMSLEGWQRVFVNVLPDLNLPIYSVYTAPRHINSGFALWSMFDTGYDIMDFWTLSRPLARQCDGYDSASHPVTWFESSVFQHRWFRGDILTAKASRYLKQWTYSLWFIIGARMAGRYNSPDWLDHEIARVYIDSS